MNNIYLKEIYIRIDRIICGNSTFASCIRIVKFVNIFCNVTFCIHTAGKQQHY